MLKNSVALVTGGAAGLGRATVERFLQRGAKVVLCDLKSSNGAEIANANSNAIFVPADVTSEADVSNALGICTSKFGQLNVIVNCAGVSISERLYDPAYRKVHSTEEFIRILTVNTVGTFNVMRLAAPVLATNTPNEFEERGVIINTSSIAAYEGQMGQVAYAAAKAAIAGMTLPASRELSAIGIRVMAIAPGLFETDHLGHLKPRVLESIVDVTPFPVRLGKPDEFAKLVQTIVENPMLNGETIRLDGGLRLP